MSFKTQILVFEKLVLSAGLSIGVLASCTQETLEPQSRSSEEAVPLNLTGSIFKKDVADTLKTRGAYEAIPSGGLPIGCFRKDNDAAGGYTTNASYLLGDLGAAGTIVFESKQYYLTRETNNNTLLRAWHPIGTYTDNVTAPTVTIPLDGKTDVMLTRGNPSGNKKTSCPPLVFDHLLAKIVVSIYPQNALTAASWGAKLNGNVQAQPTTCTLTPFGTTGAEAPTVAFGAILNGIHPLRTTEDAVGEVLGAAFKNATAAAPLTLGYALVQPGVANVKIAIVSYLPIATAEPFTNYVTVAPPAGKTTFEAGNNYSIKLCLKTNEVIPTIKTTDWEDYSGGEISMDVGNQ